MCTQRRKQKADVVICLSYISTTGSSFGTGLQILGPGAGLAHAGTMLCLSRADYTELFLHLPKLSWSEKQVYIHSL